MRVLVTGGVRSGTSHDLVGVLPRADGHVMVDFLGTWLTAMLDERGLWDAPADEITCDEAHLVIAGRALRP